MTRASKGLRTGTRNKLKGKLRQKFTAGIFMQEFKPGDKIIINPLPSSQKGVPHLRMLGEGGEVVEKRGGSYIVKVKLGNATRRFAVRPEHLKRRKK